MESTEFVAQQDVAVPQESAPVTEAKEQTVPVEPVSEVSEPAQEQQAEQPKAVKELIAQRKKRQQAEQEAAYWRGVAEGKQPVQQSQPVPEVRSETAPKLEDYEDWDQFEQAKEQYIIQQAEARLEAKMKQQQVQQEQAQIDAKFKAKWEQALETEPELMDILHSMPANQISDAMASLIKQSDMSIELIKYLGENRQTAATLARMSPHQVGFELGKIEATLEAKSKQARQEAPKRVTMAPEPIQTVTPAGITDPDPDTMPIEEWMKRYGQPTKRR